MIRQYGNVRRPVPKCETFHRKDIQAEIKIFPKAFRTGFLFKIPVGCGNHTHIDLPGFLFSHPFKMLIL